MASAPPQVLLIDDDRSVLEMVEEALKSHGMVVHPFNDGRRALGLLEQAKGPAFDLVVSDINMDGMDGFDVIHRVKSIRPHLPVVLMTAESSVDYAIRAMRMGAANFFMKPVPIREMVKSVFHLVEAHREYRQAESGLKGLAEEFRRFQFRSDEADIPGLLKHLTERLVPLGFATDQNIDVVAMAFHEALVNALEHGNLELDSDLKADLFSLDEDPYDALRRQRLQDPAYAGRLLEVETRLSEEAYEVVIADSGPGFEAHQLISPEDAAHQARHCGRGLPLIQLVMDEVAFNDRGNQIRLTLRRKA
ncbi:MAG TPA: response regulator [Holophagaceae bacterium]|nr:response regulator [Holophagaceae bacterium]